jgi:hypothetical protein
MAGTGACLVEDCRVWQSKPHKPKSVLKDREKDRGPSLAGCRLPVVHVGFVFTILRASPVREAVAYGGSRGSFCHLGSSVVGVLGAVLGTSSRSCDKGSVGSASRSGSCIWTQDRLCLLGGGGPRVENRRHTMAQSPSWAHPGRAGVQSHHAPCLAVSVCNYFVSVKALCYVDLDGDAGLIGTCSVWPTLKRGFHCSSK